MKLPCIASHLANKPSMPLMNKICLGGSVMNPLTYIGDFPEDAYEFIRERKRAKFESLKQGGMSVAEYKGKFYALAKHASMILPTEAERGFEQREGKRDRHSCDYGGAPLRTRGYSGRGYHSQSSRPIHATIPAFDVDYTGYSSSSSVHTSQGSSSRHVGYRGYSSHSGSFHSPTSRMGCFECGDMGHFVRDCLRTECGGYGGYRRSFLLLCFFETSTCIIPVFHRPGTVLFDLSLTYSYVSTYFTSSMDILCESLDLPVHISTPIGDYVVVDRVYQLCIVTLMGYDTHADLKRGCLAYLALIRDTSVETPILESIPVVSEFSEVFLINLPSLQPDCVIDFCIDIELDTQPISIPHYRIAPAE
ncbi:hypothetical protein R3W88_024717 [Solanum pinnatisectum]|uniref:CCHC-type domain-containing protein n=1 Tax=Solanum pinnatisectum TaxID=50273 RepID=A0AAV9M365_9SOLN|nr:hypothetical protein R3W88_024717 [Solanum pinnatisectum]